MIIAEYSSVAGIRRNQKVRSELLFVTRDIFLWANLKVFIVLKGDHIITQLFTVNHYFHRREGEKFVSLIDELS